MAITYVDSAGHNGAPSSSATVTIPAGTLTDDVLVLSVSHSFSGADADPTVTDDDTGGNTWTLLYSQTLDTQRRGTAWWKRATGGTASKTITASVTSKVSTNMAAAVVVYRGCLTGSTPHEGALGETNAGGNETMAGFTPSVSNCMICLTVYQRSNISVSSQSCTTPGALTERVDKSGAATAVSHASALQGAAAATGAFTWAQTDYSTTSIAFALKPAVVSYTLSVGVGAFVLSGQAINFFPTQIAYTMTVGTGTFTVTGNVIGFAVGCAPFRLFVPKNRIYVFLPLDRTSEG